MKQTTLVLVVALALVGCGGTETIKTKPEPVTVTVAGAPTETSSGGVTGETEAATTTEETGGAGVGDAIELAGFENGSSVEVTVMKVVDPAPHEAYFGPEKGNRFVGIQLRIRNSGSTVYDDCPANGSALVDSEDQQWNDPALGSAVKPDLACVKIRPGDKRVGYVAFELPKKAKLRTFQFGTESGFGPEAGEWTLR